MSYNDNIFQEENLLNGDARQYLLQTAGWTKFLSIVGFVFTGLGLLGAFSLLGSGAALSYAMGFPFSSALLTTIVLFYIAFLLLYMYPIYCLFKFSVCIKDGIRSNNAGRIAEAMKFQKRLYMFIGILLIIVLSFYLLFALFGGLAMLAAR